MVNIRNRVNTRTNSNKRGVGNQKKFCGGLNNVNKKSLNLSSVENPNDTAQIPLLLTISKSGRIGKKNKGSLNVMDNILKSELLISNNELKKNANSKARNNPINSINNNSIDVGGQNEKQKAQSKAPVPSKRKANNKTDSKDNRKKIRKESPKPMEPLLREEVINKMKSILSSGENEIFSNSKSKRNKPKLTKTNNKQEDTDISLGLIKCTYCEKLFKNQALLGKHLLSHDEIRPHVCPLCPRPRCFRYQSTLKLHIQRRHPDSIQEPEFYRCALCDETFLMPESLELHFESHIQNVFKCIFCNEKFTNRLKLTEHEKSHSTEDNLFKCDHCNLTITNPSSFSIHMKKHRNAHDFICQYCGKEFNKLGGIRRHVKVCHDDETIKCPICKKRLKGHMSEHMRLHQQERPHICTLCGQTFTQSTQLTVHKRSHTGARPYSCKICFKLFGHSNALMLHIRIHTGEKPFQCAMCPLSFSQLPHMKTHMIKIHGKEHSYKCMKCDELFKFKKHLDAHEKVCNVGERELTLEEKIQASMQSVEDVKAEAGTNLSALRFQLAHLLSMIASPFKLKYLGFNKRLIDDVLEDAIDAIRLKAYRDNTVSPMKRLKINIEILLGGTVSKQQMDGFQSENKTIEEILMLLTGENNNNLY